jgi:nifR3 family TIM-barrel protein
MAGVADTAFRTVCRSFGAGYVVGEMASSKGLCMSDKRTAELLTVTRQERPMAVQLFGDDPEIMAEAAKKAAEFEPDIIDINMGCPAPKVAMNGGGSALMKDLPLAGQIIEHVVRAVELPVTVKVRKGWDDEHINAVELCKIAQESGAAAVTVHARTREQMYRPPADLEIIAKIKAAVSIPVIGNGDIFTPVDAKRMYDETGCDLVMVGRGALGAPWFFEQLEKFLETGECLPAPNVESRMGVMLRHIRLLCDDKGEHCGMREARKHAAWYMKGLKGAAALRLEAGRLEHFPDIERLADMACYANRPE